VDETTRLLLRIDLVCHGCATPIRGQQVRRALQVWNKGIEIQFEDCIDNPGDTRQVTIGQETPDTDGTPPLCLNNVVHSGQPEELREVFPLFVGSSGLAGLTHHCIISCQPRQQGEWVEGREVHYSRRLHLVKGVERKLSLKWGFTLESSVGVQPVHQDHHERDLLQGRVGQSSKVLTRHNFAARWWSRTSSSKPSSS
jgi:hypothetical protein